MNPTPRGFDKELKRISHLIRRMERRPAMFKNYSNSILSERRTVRSEPHCFRPNAFLQMTGRLNVGFSNCTFVDLG